ncbi:MAG: hypothetical protein SFY67_08265 [Candidatus Melainabacteria bacterium]|nr:hypothetical protein [Candidatus Melainabacteria bacterium]
MNLANGRVCPNKFLADMAESENPYVRMSAALNPHTDKTLLEKLCCDESPDVRYITASSTYLPVHLLWKLKNDENPHVRWRAEVTLVKLGVIRQVC